MNKLFDSKNSKKAQGLSLNIIIIAVIALIILVVLVVIFTGKVSIFGKTTKDCDAKGGLCLASCSGQPVAYAYVVGTNCDDQGLRCCIPVE